MYKNSWALGISPYLYPHLAPICLLGFPMSIPRVEERQRVGRGPDTEVHRPLEEPLRVVIGSNCRR